jgi:uncharacterized protein YmfQ (DUF2313 family)
MSDTLPVITAGSLVKLPADFQAEILSLMPTGLAWPKEPDALQSQVALALAQTFARLNARAIYLLTDAFPSTTVELLPEWEAALGLPDPCAGQFPTIAQRQMQVAARFAAGGGQSVSYLINFAALLGTPITIAQNTPAKFGIATFGQPMNNDQWAFVWTVTVTSLAIYDSTFGVSRFGDPFRAWGNAVLVCEINRIKPAHTLALFRYTGTAVVTAPIGEFTIGVSAIA